MGEFVFWLMIALILYAYVGYGIVLFFCDRIWGGSDRSGIDSDKHYEPTVCLLVASFNEECWIERKVRNSLELVYPPEKLTLCWVTDGSDDNSARLLKNHGRIMHLHKPPRLGKIAAVNRGMEYIDSEIVLFSDANSMLSPQAVREITRHFEDPKVGCVAGGKRVLMEREDQAAASGEGIYWRYESWIKSREARIGSCVGAAGELFAVRRKLLDPVEEDTLTEDFVISMRIAMKGHKVDYCEKAYATETASSTIAEEFKRKRRIAAGNLQCLLRMPQMLNPFRHRLLAFQYFSHKFLRSLLAPFFLPALLPLNVLLLYQSSFFARRIYGVLLVLQILFYSIALMGKLFESRRLSIRFLFIPYYLVMMNAAGIAGCYRYLAGKQSVKWEKTIRRQAPC